MAKLGNLKPTLGGLPSRFGTAPANEQQRTKQRATLNPWRQWYKTARWQKLRLAIFLRDMFTCQMCHKVEGKTSRLVCDHRIPHRGDERLFWDEANLQTLCKPCHDTEKQREEQGALKGVWY